MYCKSTNCTVETCGDLLLEIGFLLFSNLQAIFKVQESHIWLHMIFEKLLLYVEFRKLLWSLDVEKVNILSTLVLYDLSKISKIIFK